MDAARARRLRPADEPEVVEHLAHDPRRPPRAAPTRRPGTGSRSTRSSSGCSRSSARTGCGCSSRQPRFAIQASAAASRGTTSSAVRPEGKRSSTTSIQSGRVVGRALLVEELAVDAVGVAHEHVRPAARAAQRALGHREVVLHDLELGDPRLGEVDLARVRDRDLAARDLEGGALALRSRHAPSIAKVPAGPASQSRRADARPSTGRRAHDPLSSRTARKGRFPAGETGSTEGSALALPCRHEAMARRARPGPPRAHRRRCRAEPAPAADRHHRHGRAAGPLRRPRRGPALEQRAPEDRRSALRAAGPSGEDRGARLAAARDRRRGHRDARPRAGHRRAHPHADRSAWTPRA